MSKANKYFTSKRITTLALMVALGYGLSWLEFPIFPAAPFLKLDFSSVPTLLSAYMLGPIGAIVVEGVKQLLIFFTHSDTGGVGQIANFLMTTAFTLPPSLLYLKFKGRKNVAIGMAIGAFSQIAVSLLVNRYINFPLYVKDAAKSMFASLWQWVLAFNAIKAVIISVITFVIYKQLSVALSRLFPDGKNKKTERVSGIFSTFGEEQTSEIAKKLASTLKGGEIILLNGELGAGKTVFVRALSGYLGAEESVVSPTFTLMNEYNGEKFRVVHIDAYRLNSGREAYEAGLTEEFGAKNTVCCIEWADNIKDAIAGNTITINIKYTGENQREIEIK